MKTVSAFETTDGQLFNSERAARLHQTFLNEQSSIEEFLNDKEFPYKSVPQRAIARNTITMWELWRAKK
jgi:hypothetical protein